MAGVAGRSGRKSEKPFRDALRVLLKEAGPDMPRLRKVAEVLLAQAETGDMQAIKELIDRTDGKVAQAIIGDDDADPINVLTKIERIIVHPGNPDGPGVPPPAGGEPV